MSKEIMQQDYNTFDYILIKDPHLMFGFKNRIRRSGWEKDIDKKLEDIIEYALLNEIRYVLFTGDVFEKSRRRDWSLNQILQNKNRLKKFRAAGITVVSNLGNHDYFDGHETITDTAFGDSVDSGLITYVGDNDVRLYFNIAPNVEVEISGVDYHENTSLVQERLSLISSGFKPGVELVKVVTLHSNITSDTEKLTDFTYKQLSEFNIDIINCGHYHLQGSTGAVHHLNKTYFLNPWNLTRVSRDYHVKLDEHIPEFVHVSISWNSDEKKPNIQTKVVTLEVKPFSEAFNPEAINLLQELGKTKFDFFKTIELKEEEAEVSDDSLLDIIAEEHQIEKEAIKIAKELLT